MLGRTRCVFAVAKLQALGRRSYEGQGPGARAQITFITGGCYVRVPLFITCARLHSNALQVLGQVLGYT